MLLGRERELATVLGVCRDAARGRGSVLVVSGGPGIGKSALLGVAAESLSAADVVRAIGVETERTVAFTTLQAVLWPLRDRLDELEATQAALLRGILELGPTVETSTFTVGAAALALLSVASGQRPIAAIVDDVQWADQASQEVLCFVGRRLEREHVAVLAGLRENEPSLLGEEGSFARLGLDPLGTEAARLLLERSSPEPLAPSVVEQLLDACSGNPLGLIELPLLLTEAQCRGEEPLPAPLEAGPLVQLSFAIRASGLDEGARRALLLLAASGEADVGLLLRVGVLPEAVDSAESSGLVTRRGGTLVFRHPLVRSAIYGAAAPAEQRDAHRALAAETVGARHAWHLAGAAAGPDEAAAEALATAAAAARLSGGLSAEAQALERAAELTLDDERKAERLLAAARAWRHAGRIEHGRALLDQALSRAVTVPTRAQIQLERGSMLVRQGEIDVPCELLLAEAERAAPTEPKLAARMLAEGAIALDVKPDTAAALALAEQARLLAGAEGDRPELEAVNALLTVRTSTGLPPTEEDLSLVLRAAELVETPELRLGSEVVNWVAYCLALHERDGEARRLSDRSLAEARTAGDVWSLCMGLYARAAIEQATGRIDVAHAWVSEAVQLAEQIDEPWRIAEAYGVLAETEFGRGNADATERALTAKEERFRPVRPDLNKLYRSVGLGTALVACARYDEAIPLLEHAGRQAGITVARAWYHLTPLELAEAYVLAGRRQEGSAVVRRLAEGIEECTLFRPKIKLARVRALLAPEGQIDNAFSGVLRLLEDVPQHLEHARVELCWGETLRRAGRSPDAAPHLNRALARFDALGATGWAARARGELEIATGSARRAQLRRTDALTPQELRVAGHAAGGMRDREIAALLYLSPRTVESYLHSAYRKLGVSNRTQLAGLLAADGVRPVGAAIKPVPQDP